MSCNTLTLPKGADHTLIITMYDENGNIINGSTFTKIVVFVKHINGTLIAKFSKNSATGYEIMDVTNIAIGEIKVKLLSSHTLNKPSGKLLYEVHALYPDGSLTDDGVLDLISPENYLCNIIDSITGGLTLP